MVLLAMTKRELNEFLERDAKVTFKYIGSLSNLLKRQNIWQQTQKEVLQEMACGVVKIREQADHLLQAF